MRRRWPVLAVTILLIFGWALVAAHPAAAAPGVSGSSRANGWVQPGGPVSQLGRPSVDGGPRIGTSRPQTKQNILTSSNWAGYADTGSNGQFTSVTSSWVQPAGHCNLGGDRYAAFWVGLDGYTSSTVEQTGSEVDCAGWTPRYYAWYEIYPNASANFPNQVKAGDHFTGSVRYLGSNQFLLTLTDSTRGWTQTVTQTLAGAARSSAEVIAEAPCCTYRGGILPLTNFGTVGFSAAKVNNAGLCTLGPEEITMTDTSVSSLSGCQAFSVSYTGSGEGSPFPFGQPVRGAEVHSSGPRVQDPPSQFGHLFRRVRALVPACRRT